MCGKKQIEHLQTLLSEIMGATIEATQALAGNTEHVLSLSTIIDEPPTIQNIFSAPFKTQIQQNIAHGFSQCHAIYRIGVASHILNVQKEHWVFSSWIRKIDKSTFDLNQNIQQRLDINVLHWIDWKVLKYYGIYIYGPHIDYSCYAALTISVVAPIFWQKKLVGIAVIDLLVADLEKLIAPLLNKIQYSIVITNEDFRIVFSNSVLFRTGDLFTAKAKLIYESHEHSFKILVV